MRFLVCLALAGCVACADERLIAGTPQVVCEESRDITLTRHNSRRLDGIVARPDGASVFYVDERQFARTDLGVDGAMEAGPFFLGDQNAFLEPQFLPDSPGFTVAFTRRLVAETEVFLARIEDEVVDERQFVNADLPSSQPQLEDRAGTRWLAWKEGANLSVGRVGRDGLERTADVAIPMTVSVPLSSAIIDDRLYVLVERDGMAEVERFDESGIHLGSGAVVASTVAELFVDDSGPLIAFGTAEAIELVQLVDGFLGEPVGRIPVTAPPRTLRLARSSGEPRILAWIDTDNVAWLAFDGVAEPRRVSADAGNRIELHPVPGGVLAAFEVEEPRSIRVRSICRP
ncbi:MAG: hypothetical protein AAGF12_06165 [Myxococcota bacterium]